MSQYTIDGACSTARIEPIEPAYKIEMPQMLGLQDQSLIRACQTLSFEEGEDSVEIAREALQAGAHSDLKDAREIPY